ncbi:MAG: OmpA family protein [Xanthobacteraceae bacterium]|nr:OmpA family protein [Xanthobacteraceae bacterium]
MSTRRQKFKFGATGAVLALALTAASAVAIAQDTNLEQRILQSLTPVGKPNGLATRSLTSTPAPAEPRNDDNRFLESIKNRSSRSLTTTEREHLASIAKDRPSVDVEINFPFSSADIGSAAMPAVAALGRALSSPELKGGTFVLAGHTDGVGSYPSNQELSERRAEAVKRYLVSNFQIPAASLVTVGYGKTKLKNESNPNASENRRVQIVNMEEKAVSQK